MTPESKVKAAVKKILGEINAFWYMPMGNAVYSKNGVPDFLVCFNGHFVGIETKAGKNKPTALQELMLERIQNAGGLSLVIDETNIDKLKDWLYEWQKPG